jgi:ATP-dependent helicase/nuclease subunit A
MSSAGTTWTKQQRDAIQTIGRSVLVSAAAGSGKTAVLAERCAYLVCDASPTCDIDQLLVVTFTESAAAQMKAKIHDALRDRLAKRHSEKLARQLALVEHAHVSTVHGFCARLLRQNFNLAGLDPQFVILDGDEAALLRLETATDMFHRRYEIDESGDFQRLIDAYGDGDDQKLIGQVVAAHNLLCSLVDPTGWIADARRRIEESAHGPLEKTEMGKELLKQIDEALDGLSRSCVEAHKSISRMPRVFSGYVAQLEEMGQFLGHCKAVLRDNGLDMQVSEWRDFAAAMPPAPRIPSDVPGKELAKSLLDGVKDSIREGNLAELLEQDCRQWQTGMAELAPHAQIFLSLVADFGGAYDAAKRSARRLDFADLERLTLQILCKSPELVDSLHRQFRHVLVDEYQDINEIQDAILSRVSREYADGEHRGNLFCVGDVKQSIFRFRLAEPLRFLERQARFRRGKGGAAIDLRENFRSRATLLDAINGVFSRLLCGGGTMIHYDQSHQLRPGKKYPDATDRLAFPGAPIELHLLPIDLETAQGEEAQDGVVELEDAQYEAILAARQIRKMMGTDGDPRRMVVDADSGAYRPIELRDIVILLRAMKFKADVFADVLRGHGIAVHSEGGAGFFQAVEVRDVLCLLAVLDNRQQDIPLAAVLRSPIGGIPDADDALARIRLAYPDESVAFHDAVAKYAREQDDELAARLRDFLAQLDEWHDQANKRPVAQLLWRLYEETGYLTYCSGLEDGQQRVANLIYLHERAAQFGTFQRQGLYRFLRFMQSLREEQELARPSIAGESEQVVRIMSIHRAKGLEFPIVFLPDLGKRHNLSDATGSILVDRCARLGMEVADEARLIRYPSLSHMLVRRSLLQQTVAEELRLLYVAMTRAKEHLVMIGTVKSEKIDRWRTLWQNHCVAMPADVGLAAMSVLDWIGPVEAMTASAKPPVFQVVRHDAAEVRAWQNPADRPPAFTAMQEQLARLQSIGPAATPDSPAMAVIRRFESRYPFDAQTRQAATASVTSIAKTSGGAVTIASADSPERKLDLPLFFVEQSVPKPTDIGTATHLVLQHLDFADSGSEKLQRQIESLQSMKLISSQQAKMVDLKTIQWLLESDLGGILKTHRQKLMREVPFALACGPDGSAAVDGGDPMDRIMVRGRIDLLLPLPDGLAIVDYKTDNVSGQWIEQRRESYRGQMQLYRRAIEQVAGQKVAAVYLVFLSARQIMKL